MGSKKSEYRLVPKALEDMEAIWLYSFRTWGVKQADSYVDDLADVFKFLGRNSKAGIVCDYIRQKYRRYPVNSHIIFYRETEYGVEIMRILHCRMLPTLHFD